MKAATRHASDKLHGLVVLAAAVWAAAVSPCLGCLWHSDTDTLEEEHRAIPAALDIIVGRFERNPPLYYEMRLGRVSKQVESEPDNLLLYDDGGVACDKLGRSDEAIAWMERKIARIDALAAKQGETPELVRHRYRYLANAGTLWIHRWLRNGADRSMLDEVAKARDFIAEAIRLNPGAHFGREKYQLMAMEWIFDGGKGFSPGILGVDTFLDAKKMGYPNGIPIPGFDDSTPSSPNPKMEEAVLGVAGLIALGNGWESFDVYNTLTLALLAHGDAWLGYMARLRCQEILAAGGKPLAWPDLTVEDFAHMNIFWGSIVDEQKPFLREYEQLYKLLRADADAWQAARTEFMMARLKEGRHPDTDKTFWNGYQERPAPELKVSYKLSAFRRRFPSHDKNNAGRLLMAFGVLLLAVGGATALQVKRKGWRSLLGGSKPSDAP